MCRSRARLRWDGGQQSSSALRSALLARQADKTIPRYTSVRGLRASRLPRIGGVVTVAGSAGTLAMVVALMASTSNTPVIR